MELVSIVILVLLIVLVVLVSLLFQWTRSAKSPDGLSLLQQQMNQLSSQVTLHLTSVTNQLQSTTGQIGDRLDSASKVFADVRERIGVLSGATERFIEIGKSISELQDILRPPKLRGELGELFLENLLTQILPAENYTMQYTFKNGTKVDAIIRLSNGLVSVDAKFPLENFRRIMEGQSEEEKASRRKEFMRDVKKHVDSISSKYILPDEGTFDFALMYIPAENVYYEIILKDEGESGLLPYALQKRVIPVSPYSFYAYLRTILLGLRGMRIEKEARELQDALGRLQGDFERFKKDFDTIGTHLSNAKNKYDDASRAVERFGDKLGGIGMGAKGEIGPGQSVKKVLPE